MRASTRGSWPGDQLTAGRRSALTSLLVAVVVMACSVASGASAPPPPTGPIDARIGGAAPLSWDPARAGDVGSASTLGQVFEGLTAFDANSNVQPALARSWSVENGGRRIVFELRDGLRFSDGSPLTGEDVVSSWLRLLRSYGTMSNSTGSDISERFNS